jgi:aminopeptidase N
MITLHDAVSEGSFRRRFGAHALAKSMLVSVALAGTLIAAAANPTVASAAPHKAANRAHRFLDNSLPFKAPRDRRIDVEHMDVELRVNPAERSVSGRVVFTVAVVHAHDAPTLDLDAVDLDITAARWLDAGTAAFSAGAATVAKLPAPGALRSFPLPSAQVGTRHRLELTWSAKPQRGLYFVGPDADEPKRRAQLWTQGETQEARHWLPCPDDPDERFTWSLRLDVPADLEPVSNGDVVDTVVRAGRKIRTFAMKTPHPIYLLSVAAAPFVEVVHGSGRVRLSSWAMPEDVARAKKTGDKLPAMLKFLEGQTRTPYPHQRYGQIWVDEFAAGGMENVTLTTLTRRALGDDDSDLDWDADGLLAHELAHQWFGDTVTCRSWADLWLNEGFATYYQKLWTLHDQGADRFAEEMAAARGAAVGTDDGTPRAIVQNRFNRPGELFDAHSYTRGAWVLHMLRERLGHDAFDAGIAAYLALNRFHSVETADLQGSLEASSGQSLRAFFARWVYTPGLPHLSVSANWRREQGGKLIVEVEQTQAIDARRPAFDLDVEIGIAAAKDGKVVLHTIHLHDKKAVLTLPMPEPPALVMPDPQMRLLAGWKLQIDADLLLGGLHASRHPDVRARSVEALRGSLARPKVVAAIIALLQTDSARHVRTAAARTLGAAPRADVRAALAQAAAGDSDSHVRAASIAALGQLRDTASLAVVVAATKQRSAMVVREALLATFAIDRKEARKRALAALARDAFRDQIRIDALHRLAALSDVRDLERIWEATRPGHNKALRGGAVLALAAYATRVEGVRDAVRDHIEGLLHESALRLRGAAVTALGALSDPLSRRALLDAAGRERYEHLSEQMTTTAADLGKALPVSARMLKLEEALEALTRRVEDKREGRGRNNGESGGGKDKRGDSNDKQGDVNDKQGDVNDKQGGGNGGNAPPAASSATPQPPAKKTP